MRVFMRRAGWPGKGLLRRAVASFLLLFAAFSPAQGAERAWIDGALQISRGVYVAVGGVRLVQGETEIRAERLRYVEGESTVYFEGNVRVTQGGSELTGEAFLYDLETGEGELTHAVARVEVEPLREPLFLLSERMQVSEAHTALENVRLTTCTPVEKAGYYLVSRRMDIYPGDRIVLRNVRFVESGVTLFYWPYVSIPIREEDGERLRFPEIGYNSRDGWYAKLRYPYEGPGEGYGEAALDVVQRRGVGVGVSHTYSDAPGWEGSVTAYRLNPWGEGVSELRLGLNQRLSLGEQAQASVQGAFFSESDPFGGEDREYRLALSLERVGLRGSTRIDWGGQWYAGEKEGVVGRLRLSHNTAAWGWQWRLTGERYRRNVAGDPLKDALEYRSVLERAGNGYRFALTLEQDVHPSLLTESKLNPAWKRVNRMPEAVFEYDLNRAVPLLPVRLSAGYGRYEEVRTSRGADVTVRADRHSLGVRLHPLNFSLGRLGSITFQGGAEWYGYSTGDRRLVLSADHQYRVNLSNRWSFYGVYSYRQGFLGVTPFRFDSVSDHERVSGRLLYAHPWGTFSLSSGYDFLSGQPSDVVAQVSIGSGRSSSVTLQGGYSPVTREPSYVAGSVRWNPGSQLSLAASVRYDFAKEAVDSLAWEMVAAAVGWRLQVDTLYDGSEGLERAKVALVRDLGCREIGLGYDGGEKAVWIEYRINALPGAGVRLGGGADRFIFDSPIFSSDFGGEDDEE